MVGSQHKRAGMCPCHCFAQSDYLLPRFSLGLSAYSFSSYPRITVQLQSPAWGSSIRSLNFSLFPLLPHASSALLSYVQAQGDNREHRRHDRIGVRQWYRWSSCCCSQAVFLASHLTDYASIQQPNLSLSRLRTKKLTWGPPNPLQDLDVQKPDILNQVCRPLSNRLIPQSCTSTLKHLDQFPTLL